MISLVRRRVGDERGREVRSFVAIARHRAQADRLYLSLHAIFSSGVRTDENRCATAVRRARNYRSPVRERGGAFATGCSRETRTRTAFPDVMWLRDARDGHSPTIVSSRVSAMAKLRGISNAYLIAIGSPRKSRRFSDLSRFVLPFNFALVCSKLARVSSHFRVANFAIRKARSKSRLYSRAKSALLFAFADRHRGRTGRSYFVMLTSDVRGSGTPLEFYKPRKSETDGYTIRRTDRRQATDGDGIIGRACASCVSRDAFSPPARRGGDLSLLYFLHLLLLTFFFSSKFRYRYRIDRLSLSLFPPLPSAERERTSGFRTHVRRRQGRFRFFRETNACSARVLIRN